MERMKISCQNFGYLYLVYFWMMVGLANPFQTSVRLAFQRYSNYEVSVLQISSNNYEYSRRSVPSSCMRSIFSLCVVGSISIDPMKANAASKALNFFRERQQLDLCLVTLLRVRYWAEATGLKMRYLLSDVQSSSQALISDSNNDSNARIDSIKSLYLQARLGSKAILTGKIGGGSNLRVLTLATLDVKDSINDIRYWYGNIQSDSTPSATINSNVARLTLEHASEDIIESLANIVEFDGLETTQDPSPRSTLALRMFSVEKAVFVQRLLLERIVPSCDLVINLFGTTKRMTCENFVRFNYPDEAVSLNSLKQI